MGRDRSSLESPDRERISSRRKSSPQRERSPVRHRSSHKTTSPPREKPSSRNRSPRRGKSRSPAARLPSSRTRRVSGAQFEKETEEVSEIERGRKPSSRTRSPTRAKSRSPPPSPQAKRLKNVQSEREPEDVKGRDHERKPSSRTRSPRHLKPVSNDHRSPSPQTKILEKFKSERQSEDVRDRNHEKKASSRTRSPRHSEPVSPAHRSPSPRMRILKKSKSERESEDVRERDHERKPSNRTRSPRHLEQVSPAHRAPSPGAKRLKKVQSERESEDLRERESKRNHNKGGERDTHRERGSDRDFPNDNRERRSGRDAVDGVSKRSRHGRSTSPADRHQKSRHRSRSPRPAVDNSEVINSRASEDRNGDDDAVSRMKAAAEALEAKDKQKPSFELSGKLAAETNRVRGITLLFNEPPDARKPDIRWRLYVFKGGEVLNEPLYVHRNTCYLFGRERKIADVPTDHPSCSKQHAVLAFRQVEKEQPDGTLSKQVRPYLMDLGSTNGTFVNDNRIEPQCYYELFEKDTLKFGNSSREYVLLHENSSG